MRQSMEGGGGGRHETKGRRTGCVTGTSHVAREMGKTITPKPLLYARVAESPLLLRGLLGLGGL